MKSNINESPLLRYSQIPKRWGNIINYDQATDMHYADGWRDVIFPSYNPNIERLGDLIRNGENVTYEVLPLSDEEIQQRIKQSFESTRQEAIQLKLETQVLTEAQEATDIAEILENKPFYKFWEDYPDQFSFPANYKVNHLVDKEVQTYRIIQPHNKQVDRRPNKVPALWTEITLSNGIEIWNQPTGGDGKYPYLDPATGEPYRVLFNGETWENNHQGGLNVWQPGVFGWKKI
jgi:hypothetical protein